MIRLSVVLLSLCLICQPLLAADPDVNGPGYWPQWRGPLGTGSIPSGNPPVEWSEDSNIRWKTPLPGTGYGTPVVWGNDIFVTAAVNPDGNDPGKIPSGPVTFMLMAVDRTSGTVRWEREVCEAMPHEKFHQENSWTASSPVVDGERVYTFVGSHGLYCFSIDGDLLWEKDFGDMTTRNAFGEGASPALYGNRLVVPWDHEEQSFIVTLDATTGDEIWRMDRDEGTTWMTPIVVDVAGKPQVITTGTNKVRSYDLASGDLVWEDDGLTELAVPTSIASDGIVYVTSGFRGAAMRAIRLAGARGNLSGTPAVLWSYDQDTPYVPSPVLLDGLLYFNKVNNGTLTCIDVATGKPLYANQKLEGIKELYASPIGVRDRVYVMSRDGVTIVIKHGAEFTVLATNTLDDNFEASPVAVGDVLYLRGHNNLYCIGR